MTAAPVASHPWLRHTLATLAYRAEKVLRGVPGDFANVRPSAHSRTALETLSHLGDLMEWAERMVRGESRWQAVPQVSWEAAKERFYAALAALDAGVSAGVVENSQQDVIFQGPIADAFTHVGQLAMMRGMAGVPVRPENYSRAEITVGRVGADQSSHRREFDGDSSQPPSR